MSGFQSPITVKQALERMDKREMLLPAFQRVFVWTDEQIQNLFDSLMKEYPFGSMLFWKVKNENIKKNNRFYPFVQNFRQWYHTFENYFATENHKDFHAVLDGQQRLTALYIGFRGTYAFKSYRKKWEDNEISLPSRKLYLNLTQKTNEGKFEFLFLSAEESNRFEEIVVRDGIKWFRVGAAEQISNILDFSEKHQQTLSKEEKNVVQKLIAVTSASSINFFEIEDGDYQEAVSIFIRINSGGTQLSYSDILFSMVIASWTKIDAKEDFNLLIKEISDKGFLIGTDYIIKSFLFLFHNKIQFDLSSFTTTFLAETEDLWPKIREAIKEMFNLLYDFGLDSMTLTSNLATLPILYYLYHKEIYTDFCKKVKYREDRVVIKKWLLAMLVRRAFSGSSDTILNQARQAFTKGITKFPFKEDIDSFPAKEINISIKGLVEVGDEFIEEILNTQKDDKFAFSILGLLYPNLDYTNHSFHKDHLHPCDSFNEDLHDWREYNSILNLQLLDENENKSKREKPLKKWIESKKFDEYDKKIFLSKQHIPNIDLSIENYEAFIKERKKNLIKAFYDLLN